MTITINRIKTAARSLFARYGYEGTSLSAIAREVGIKKPSIYAHFDGKEDLFLSIFDDCIEKETRFYLDIIHKTIEYPVYDKLYEIFRHLSARNELEDDNMVFVMRGIFLSPDSLITTLQEKFIAFEKIQSDTLSAIFIEGIKSGVIQNRDISILLASYFCMLDGLNLERHYYNDEEYRSRVDAVWTIYWSGIRSYNQQ